MKGIQSQNMHLISDISKKEEWLISAARDGCLLSSTSRNGTAGTGNLGTVQEVRNLWPNRLYGLKSVS